MTEDIITPDKSNAEYLAGLSFPVSENDPDYAALRIGNFIFGGSTLASRLGDRIRQKEGLSYGATSAFTASACDPMATLTVTVSTNPANIEKVTVAVIEELQRYLKDGPTEKELADAKRAFVESQKVARTGDAAIAGEIVTNLNVGRAFAHTAELEKAILALTCQDRSRTLSASMSIRRSLSSSARGISKSNREVATSQLSCGENATGRTANRADLGALPLSHRPFPCWRVPVNASMSVSQDRSNCQKLAPWYRSVRKMSYPTPWRCGRRLVPHPATDRRDSGQWANVVSFAKSARHSGNRCRTASQTRSKTVAASDRTSAAQSASKLSETAKANGLSSRSRTPTTDVRPDLAAAKAV